MKSANRILSIFLAGYMLLAMGGLSIYYHFCSCTNSVITSVIVEESCCDSTLPQDDCCGNHESKSCHSETENDCDCNTNVITLKVDNASFTSQSFSLVEVKSLLAVIDIFNFNSLISKESEKNLSPLSYSAPPIYGKELVISLQSNKIPDHIS